MLYIIGLGLNIDGISMFGLEAVKRCKKVYLENYTVDFPYSIGELSELIDKKIISADRGKIESLEIVDESKKMDIALLVYGSPLTATTHITLIQEAKKTGARYKVIYSASVFDAIAETGLQLYKFGKITSIPKWKKNFTPDSFMDVIKDNQKIEAHSLILADIGLEFNEAIEQLEISANKHKFKINKLIICSNLGTKYKKIIYKEIKDLKDIEIKKPYCIIIPSKLHFVEEEFLDELI